MRFLIISIIFLSSISLCAAQTNTTKKHTKKTPEQKADKKVNKLAQELALTPDQTQKLKAIFLESDLQLDSLGQQIKAIKAKREADLKQTLTEEQYKQYKESKKQNKNTTTSPPATNTTK